VGYFEGLLNTTAQKISPSRLRNIHNKMRPTKTIETIAAYHEAGHAVVAHFQRIKVKQIALIVDVELGILGYTHTGGAPKWVSRDPTDRLRMNVERFIVMCFAGELAEARFRGEYPRPGMGSDDERAIEISLHICGNEEIAEAFRHYCWCLSRALVAQHWREIEALTTALLERKTLNESDVSEIIVPGSAALKAGLSAASKELKRKKAQRSPRRQSTL
jgi:ATP-dependent Zn protease